MKLQYYVNSSEFIIKVGNNIVYVVACESRTLNSIKYTGLNVYI